MEHLYKLLSECKSLLRGVEMSKRKNKQKGRRSLDPSSSIDPKIEQLASLSTSHVSSVTTHGVSPVGSSICYVCDKFVPRMSSQAPSSEDALNGELSALLKTVGTGLWRIQRAMKRFQDNQTPEGLEKVSRHIESLVMLLAQQKFEIVDHTGQEYRGTEALSSETSASNETDDNRVIETIKPTIRYKKNIVQVGEVIVGGAENEGG